jgi:hypothetical protein
MNLEDIAFNAQASVMSICRFSRKEQTAGNDLADLLRKKRPA